MAPLHVCCIYYLCCDDCGKCEMCEPTIFIYWIRDRESTCIYVHSSICTDSHVLSAQMQTALSPLSAVQSTVSR